MLMDLGFSYSEARHLPEDLAGRFLEAWSELKTPKAKTGKLVKSKGK